MNRCLKIKQHKIIKKNKISLSSLLLGLIFLFSGTKRKIDSKEILRKDLSTGISGLKFDFNELSKAYRASWFKVIKK